MTKQRHIGVVAIGQDKAKSTKRGSLTEIRRQGFKLQLKVKQDDQPTGEENRKSALSIFSMHLLRERRRRFPAEES